MQQLNLPPQPLRLRKGEKSIQVLDALRHRVVALTPEEWVRQNFVSFLITNRQCPAALMANEVSLVQNGIKRRCDTLVTDRNGNPLVMVEYKAPSIASTQKVFDKIVLYNMVLRARYLIVSNGMAHFCCKIDYVNKSYAFLPDIPCYNDLLA